VTLVVPRRGRAERAILTFLVLVSLIQNTKINYADNINKPFLPKKIKTKYSEKGDGIFAKSLNILMFLFSVCLTTPSAAEVLQRRMIG
jgi:hypothetical protein